MEDAQKEWRSPPSALPLIILTFALLMAHLAIGWRRSTDYDEFQQLINSWDYFNGLKLYHDFWDNHGPLLTMAIAPLYRFLPHTHDIIPWVRILFWSNTCAVAFFTYVLARECYPDRTRFHWASVILLLIAPTFVAKSVEIRGDNPMNLLWTIALWLTIRGLRRRSVASLIMAGIALGLIFAFSVKIVFLGFALFLVFCAAGIFQERVPFKDLLVFGGAFVIPIVALFLVMWQMELLPGFLDCYFGSNLSRKLDYSIAPLYEILKDAPVWTLLFLAALVRSGRRVLKRQVEFPETALWLISTFLVIQYVLLIPTHYLQSFLPVHPPMVMLIVMMLESLAVRLNMRRWTRQSALVACAAVALIVLPYELKKTANVFSRGLRSEIRYGNWVMEHSGPDEMILDGGERVIFRPRPLPFHSLIVYIRNLHQDGVIDLEIPRRLREMKVRWVILERRILDLRISDIAFITQYYVPVKPIIKDAPLLMVAGATAGVHEGRVSPELPFDGEYFVQWLNGQGELLEDATTSTTVQNRTVSLGAPDSATTAILSMYPPDIVRRKPVTLEELKVELDEEELGESEGEKEKRPTWVGRFLSNQ